MLRISLEERKDFIAKIATVVFSENGYRAASLEDVAKKAKISKAGLYHYFKSKEEILAHILIKNSDIFLQELKENVQESKKKGLSPQDAFACLIRAYARHVNADKDRRLIVLRERHQLSSRYRKELLKREKAMFLLLRSQLNMIPGLKKGTDENVITFLLISMSHWLGYWFKEPGRLSLEQTIDQNIDAVLNGILQR